jgi:hypothetical protein
MAPVAWLAQTPAEESIEGNPMFTPIHGRKVAAATGIAAVLALGTALPADAATSPVYRITTSASLALEIGDGSSTAGAPLIQWPINNLQNQSWTTQAKSYGAWIVNAETGKCLSVDLHAPLAAGTGLVQYPCTDQKWQEWTFDPAYLGSANYIRNVMSGFVIDVPGGTGEWGAQLIQWPNNQTSNQIFWFWSLS